MRSLFKWLKGTSGFAIIKEFPAVKKAFFWGSGLWSPVIYADAIGSDLIYIVKGKIVYIEKNVRL